MTQLKWTCDICHAEIQDGKGAVCITLPEIGEARAKREAWDREHGVSLGSATTFSASSLTRRPPEAAWRRVHFACEDDTDLVTHDINVEQLRTYRQVVSATITLMEKSWFSPYAWRAVLMSLKE